MAAKYKKSTDATIKELENLAAQFNKTAQVNKTNLLEKLESVKSQIELQNSDYVSFVYTLKNAAEVLKSEQQKVADLEEKLGKYEGKSDSKKSNPPFQRDKDWSPN